MNVVLTQTEYGSLDGMLSAYRGGYAFLVQLTELITLQLPDSSWGLQSQDPLGALGIDPNPWGSKKPLLRTPGLKVHRLHPRFRV